MNPIIFSALLSWVVAQTTKVMVGLFRHGREDQSRMLWRIVWAGGMPSAHSALIASVAATIFFFHGPNSALFGLSLIMTGIVVYDRSRAYAIYETFQSRYPVLKHSVQKDPVLKDLVGHRASEILVGISIGLVCGWFVFKYFEAPV